MRDVIFAGDAILVPVAGPSGHRGLLVSRVLKVSRVFRGRREKPVLKALRETRVTLAQLAHKAHRGNRDRRVSKAPLALLVPLAPARILTSQGSWRKPATGNSRWEALTTALLSDRTTQDSCCQRIRPSMMAATS